MSSNIIILNEPIFTMTQSLNLLVIFFIHSIHKLYTLQGRMDSAGRDQPAAYPSNHKYKTSGCVVRADKCFFPPTLPLGDQIGELKYRLGDTGDIWGGRG